jgi:hypothetical protein
MKLLERLGAPTAGAPPDPERPRQCPPYAEAVSFGTLDSASRWRRSRGCGNRDCAGFRHESSLRLILAMLGGSRASSGPTRASSGLTPRAGPLAAYRPTHTYTHSRSGRAHQRPSQSRARPSGLSASAHARRLKHRPDVGAPVPTDLTGELRLQIRQTDIVRPAPGVDHERMGAPVVAAVDEKPGWSRRSHFPEGNFLFALHVAIEARRGGRRQAATACGLNAGITRGCIRTMRTARRG